MSTTPPISHLKSKLYLINNSITYNFHHTHILLQNDRLYSLKVEGVKKLK